MAKPMITSAEFVKGVVAFEGLPKKLHPHVVFVGRSNVGKSSFINSMVHKKGLARSSHTPGRTTEANFYEVNRAHYFVDLPGYGFARQSKQRRDDIEKIIYWYLTDPRLPIQTLVLLVDSVVGATEDDLTTRNILLEQEGRYEVVVIAHKWDKLKQKEAHTALQKLSVQFPGMKIIPYSSKLGKGREDILKMLLGR